jgi:hypothetical protein
VEHAEAVSSILTRSLFNTGPHYWIGLISPQGHAHVCAFILQANTDIPGYTYLYLIFSQGHVYVGVFI